MFIIDNETPVSHVYKLEPDHPTYNDLHLLDYNRPVSKDNHNVINISKSMKENNLLYAAPIIVKYTPDRLEIIDGQHRYLAAKSLNLPIYIHVLKAFLAAFTAMLVSVRSPNEIIAHTSSFEGLITLKSLDFVGDIHFPSI